MIINQLKAMTLELALTAADNRGGMDTDKILEMSDIFYDYLVEDGEMIEKPSADIIPIQ